jgi:hypothetical protein
VRTFKDQGNEAAVVGRETTDLNSCCLEHGTGGTRNSISIFFSYFSFCVTGTQPTLFRKAEHAPSSIKI